VRAWPALVAIAVLALPAPAPGHPLGNFSINRYAALEISGDAVVLRYLVDMAEIPTFQEAQEHGFAAEAGHPRLAPYLARQAERLRDGLRLDLDGRRLALRAEASDVVFAPGAGGLPTMKLGVLYRAGLPPAGQPVRLTYRDGNFAGRAGWQEVVAVPAGGVTFRESTVPRRDRSRALSHYPVDLLDSPPQIAEARVVFLSDASAPSEVAASGPGGLRLRAGGGASPRSPFGELLATTGPGLGLGLMALVVAVGLGAVHALEPGHGKTVVAAYLVGSRGTGWHAVLLGLVVTASHTAGVYVLGGVTLYASRYVMPETLYPWLGAVSGLGITAVGLWLLWRHARGRAPRHVHDHGGRAHAHHVTHAGLEAAPVEARGGADHAHGPDDHGHHDHVAHAHDDRGGHGHHDQAPPPGAVSLRDLVVLGVTGGIVPCPAALVVLLSAVAMRRIGFGLLLIVAFSVGLAAVLVAVGLLMVHARRLLARVREDGPLLGRWLPVTSAAAITVLGLVIAAQALLGSGMLARLGS